MFNKNGIYVCSTGYSKIEASELEKENTIEERQCLLFLHNLIKSRKYYFF